MSVEGCAYTLFPMRIRVRLASSRPPRDSIRSTRKRHGFVDLLVASHGFLADPKVECLGGGLGHFTCERSHYGIDRGASSAMQPPIEMRQPSGKPRENFVL